MASKSKAIRSSVDLTKRWMERITSANKVYDKWHNRYRPDRLENYYAGKQWRGHPDVDLDKFDLYTINLFYGSVESSKPALLFHKPQFSVTPKPGRGDDLGGQADEQATLCQDTLQTFVDDPDVKFQPETALALHEAFFRYGVIEVGYSADFVDNPHADKPVLMTENDQDSAMTDSDGQPVLQPERIVKHEQLFVRHIPAKQFRVSISAKNDLSANDWCGYYEWVYLDDLKRNPNYKNTTNLKAGGAVDPSLRQTTRESRDEDEQHHGMCKVWKVYDIRQMERHVFVEGFDKPLQEGQDLKAIPFAVLKFHEVSDSWLPLPLTYNWQSPQDELNETRQQQRVHRQRFNRKYVTKTGNFADDELDKLLKGGDGTVAKANVDPATAILPMPDAPLDGSVWVHLAATKEDFGQVSGIAGEQRNTASGDTATQASIMEGRSQIRESMQRSKVADWLGEIARLILITLRDKMSLEFWVKRNTDPSIPNNPEARRIAGLWQRIQASALGDFDMDVSVDVAGLSPVTQDSQRAQWMQLLALLSNPSILMLLGSSDLLLKKVISLYGIRQQSEVAEIQKSVQALSTVLGQQAGQQGAGQPGAGQPGVTAMPGAGGAPGGAGAPMQPFQTGGIDPAKMLASLGPKGPQ